MGVQNYFINIRNSNFAKNSLKLSIGTAFAQFFPLAIYPILGRLFVPDDFGLLASLTAVTSILSVFSTGRYENSILIAEDDIKAFNLLALSILLSLVILLISILPLYIFKSAIMNLLGLNSSFGWLLICPLTAFFINVFNCYSEWCVRKQYYTKLSINKITNSASVSLTKLLLGYVRIFPKGLIMGDIIGRFITMIACIVRLIRDDYKFIKEVSPKIMLNQAKRFIKFPKFIMPAQLLNTVGASGPILLIGYYFNEQIVGFFSMSMTILALPVSVISTSIRDVFRQKANEEYKINGSFDGLFKKILIILSSITILFSIIIYPFIPNIFKFVLGDTWIESGVYSQILLPMIVVDFIAISLSGVFMITEKLKQQLYWQLYFVIISILSIIIGVNFFSDIIEVLLIFMTARLSAYIYLITISYKYSKGKI